jgi:hypothetical protein
MGIIIIVDPSLSSPQGSAGFIEVAWDNHDHDDYH